jgi:hypothetical protein
MDLDPFQWKVYACRPVRFTTAEHRQLAIDGDSDRLPPVYPGSEVQACSECGRDVWVGPRGQQVQQEWEDLMIVCFFCSVWLMNHVSKKYGMDGFEVRGLGNDFVPADRPVVQP